MAELLSNDGELTLVVLALDPSVVESNRLRDAVGEIRATITEDLAGAGLKAELSGVPVMQLEIRNAVERDRLVYNTIGFVAGCLIAILFFRRVSFMIIAAGPPLIAILLALGALGWLDFRLNMFLNVMTPLIMVISFSDSMQLTFATQTRWLRRKQNRSPEQCDFDRRASLRSHPCDSGFFLRGLAVFQLGPDTKLWRGGLHRDDHCAGRCPRSHAASGCPIVARRERVCGPNRPLGFRSRGAETICGFVAARMVRRPGLYSLAGVLVVAGLGLSFARLEPRYRLADQVPDKQQAVAASNRLDAKLTGANPIDVLIEFPRGAFATTRRKLSILSPRCMGYLENHQGVGNVWSIETLRRWLVEAGKPQRPASCSNMSICCPNT
ncbi:MMPL family transporter [Pseudomonas sp. GG8]